MGFPYCVLRLLELGDINANSGHADRSAGDIPEDLAAAGEPAHASIRQNGAEFEVVFLFSCQGLPNRAANGVTIFRMDKAEPIFITQAKRTLCDAVQCRRA